MVDFRPLLFINALALMLLVTAGFASIQRDAGQLSSLTEHTVNEKTVPAEAENDVVTTSMSPPDLRETPASSVEEAPVFADVEPTPPGPLGGNSAKTTVEERSEPIQPSDTLAGTDNGIAADKNQQDTEETGRAASANKAETEPADNTLVAMIEPLPAKTASPEPPPMPEPTTAQLTLRSNVLGDSVQINGKTYGATRLDLELDPGDYNVVISKTGYKDWTQTVRLEAGDDLTLRGKLKEYTRVNYQNGTWVGGVRTGDGTYSGENGLEYTGHFVEGRFDGKGIARYPDGSRYEGEWTEGERSGEGMFRAADGSSYSGQFDNDEFNGQGTLTRANGDVLTGHWSNGHLNGHGSLATEGGMLYVGNFKDGRFHGEGTLTYPDGRHYEGGFSNGEHHGEGSEIFADGKKYVGQYIEGEFHGKGTLMNPNGSSIEATFRYGEPYGQAKLTTPEGEIFNARTSEPGVCYREKSYRATQCPPLEGW